MAGRAVGDLFRASEAFQKHVTRESLQKRGGGEPGGGEAQSESRMQGHGDATS